MNVPQRLVVVLLSLAVAALLFVRIPRHGAIVDDQAGAAGRWDVAAESLSSARASRWLATHPGTGAEVYHAWLATMPETARVVLGERPRARKIFVPHPRSHEVVLKDVLPLALLGLALYTLAGLRAGRD
jgi:hypothetical protein